MTLDSLSYNLLPINIILHRHNCHLHQHQHHHHHHYHHHYHHQQQQEVNINILNLEHSTSMSNVNAEKDSSIVGSSLSNELNIDSCSTSSKRNKGSSSSSNDDDLSNELSSMNIDSSSTSKKKKKNTCLRCLIEVEGSLGCSRCGTAHYCGKECQVKHWPVHKNNCRDTNDTEDSNEKLEMKAMNHYNQGSGIYILIVASLLIS